MSRPLLGFFSLVFAALAISGCASAPKHAQTLDLGFHGAERIEALEKKLADQSLDQQLAALYETPRRSRRALKKRLSSDPEGEMRAAAFAAPRFGTARAAAPEPRGAREVCGARFCAGVDERPLDPAFWELPERPRNPLLRWLSGRSRPPLAGYGGRLAAFPGVLLKLLFPRQYYAHLFKDSRGTLDEATVNNVKALILLDQDGNRLAWVKADLIGAFQDLREAVLRELEARGVRGFDDGNLLLHGTHTHSGLGAINPRALFQIATVDLFSEPVFLAVVENVVEAILEAEARLTPARLAAGSGTAPGLTRNRRETCEAEGDPPNPEPDPEVGVLRLDRPDGSALATVFHFAVHGTSLGAENRRFAPDNMGYAELFVEREVGGTALFFNGAEGDVAPAPPGETASSEPARRLGEALGRVVTATRDALTTTDEVRLSHTYCQLDDPDVSPSFPRPCPKTLERFQFRPLKFIAASPGCFRDRDSSGWVITRSKEKDPPLLEREGVVLGAFRIDTGRGAEQKSTLVMTLPGEPITEIGLDLKSTARGEHGFDRAWVFALSNAHMGYIVTEREYMEGGYEAGSNVFGPTEGQVFTDNALSLAKQLAP